MTERTPTETEQETKKQEPSWFKQAGEAARRLPPPVPEHAEPDQIEHQLRQIEQQDGE
jgi:hypothetical protein